jgi:membrane protein EpsK
MSFSARQGLSNYVTSIANFVASAVIGIWLTPFLVSNLGPSSYGLAILAATVVSYFGPLALTLSMTLTRYLSIARESADPQALSALMRGSVGLTAKIALVVGLILVPSSLLVPYILRLSPEYRGEATTLFLLTGVSFVLWLLCVPMSALIYSANRLDQNNFAQLAQTIVRALATVILMVFVAHQSWTVAAGAIAGSLGCLMVLTFWALRLAPATMFIPDFRSRAIGSDLRRTGLNVLVGQAGSLLLLSTELVLVNYLVDEHQTGQYAATLQIPGLVRAAIFGLSGVFGPLIFARYARGDIGGAAVSTTRAMRILGLIAALPTGFLFAMGDRTLAIWLGSGFEPFTPVLLVEMAGVAVFVTALPMYSLALAADRVFWPGVLRIFAAAAYVAGALILFQATPVGVTGVAIAMAAALIVPEIVVMAPYVAKAAGAPVVRFLGPFTIVAAAAVVSFAVTRGMLAAFSPDRLAGILGLAVAVTVVYVPVCAGFFLREEAGTALRRLSGLVGAPR